MTRPIVGCAVLLGAMMLFVVGCGNSDESEVETTVHHLVDAINSGDTIAAAALYTTGEIETTSDGDSNVVYMLLHTAHAAGDMDADVRDITLIGDNARVMVALSGGVNRGGTTVGTMTMNLMLELERSDGQWQIVPGSEERQ